jgi:8-oxo-dGTP pyrophosphatase MutT (NUDIX family)
MEPTTGEALARFLQRGGVRFPSIPRSLAQETCQRRSYADPLDSEFGAGRPAIITESVVTGERIESEILKRERLFSGVYLKLERWRLRLPDGRRTAHEIVHPPHAVAVLPLDDDGTVHLLEHHRPAVGRTVLELPAGVVEPDEDPAVTARRELLEELGLAVRELSFLHEYAHSVGYSSGMIRLYLGRGLSRPPDPPVDDTEFVRPYRVALGVLLRRIEAGEFIDTKLIVGVLLTARRFPELV